MSFENLIQDLWLQYAEVNSHVEKVHRLFETSGETIVNDHIAFRTFNHAKELKNMAYNSIMTYDGYWLCQV